MLQAFYTLLERGASNMVSAVLLLHSIALVTVTNSAILISPPNAPPGGAHHVTQGFVGFGIEAKSFPAYAGI